MLSGKFNTFEGWLLAGGDVTLDFTIYGDPTIVERVGTNLLSIAAWGTAHFDGVGFSGALAGDFTLGTQGLLACQAQDHLIELVRQ
jgi:hypothetical protein